MQPIHENNMDKNNGKTVKIHIHIKGVDLESEFFANKPLCRPHQIFKESFFAKFTSLVPKRQSERDNGLVQTCCDDLSTSYPTGTKGTFPGVSSEGMT
jgi:hypothetical protein